MEFARKHLEKYGWSEGKGLGKTENGIKEALKPKPKHSSGGVGHDIADEFTNHWWQRIYNKAAENIEVNVNKKGETKSISAKTIDKFEINTTKFVKAKAPKNKEHKKSQYFGNFVKRATLTNGEIEESTPTLNDSEDECSKVKIPKLTDEELFAACGGRTAHKGARHGLKSNGKLARIDEHEKRFLKKLETQKKNNDCINSTSLPISKFNQESAPSNLTSAKKVSNKEEKNEKKIKNLEDDQGFQKKKNRKHKTKYSCAAEVADDTPICDDSHLTETSFKVKKKRKNYNSLAYEVPDETSIDDNSQIDQVSK